MSWIEEIRHELNARDLYIENQYKGIIDSCKSILTLKIQNYIN